VRSSARFIGKRKQALLSQNTVKLSQIDHHNRGACIRRFRYQWWRPQIFPKVLHDEYTTKQSSFANQRLVTGDSFSSQPVLLLLATKTCTALYTDCQT
jgi:hypothetical protein